MKMCTGIAAICYWLVGYAFAYGEDRAGFIGATKFALAPPTPLPAGTPPGMALSIFGSTSLTAYFGCRPRPGADENHVRFRRADLDLPLSSSDHLLHRMLMKFSEKALREIAEARPSFVNKVEEAIAANPALPQAEVARQLGMSARTLSRRLAETGTNFARVVEGYRAAMARSMLRDSDLQITQIAFVLGYSDVTSFSTAFRRWTGMAPSVWRAGGGDG